MKSVIAAVSFATLLFGCSHNDIKSSDVQPIHVQSATTQQILANPDLKMVHFQFNKSDLTKDAKSVLQQDAYALKEDSTLKFQIQGFCDERGSTEYNLALGEKRAEVVRNYLQSLGIAADRISVVSYGKTNPLDTHENEKAFALNRRASFQINSDANKNASL